MMVLLISQAPLLEVVGNIYYKFPTLKVYICLNVNSKVKEAYSIKYILLQ